MYLTTFEAIEPLHLDKLKNVLEETRLDRGIGDSDPQLQDLARELFDLWLAGFRDTEELKAMLKPLDSHLI